MKFRTKRRKTINNTTFDNNDLPKSSSTSSSSSYQSNNDTTSANIKRLPIKNPPRTHSAARPVVRVLSPLPPNACLSRKFVTLPAHLNRLCKTTIHTNDSMLPFKAHHQIIKSRPICTTLPTNEPRTNKKRKRTRTISASNNTTTIPNMENSNRQVMVLINQSNHSPKPPPRPFSQSGDSHHSRSSSQDPQLVLPEAAAYYIHHASKPQLLRLRRDQLIQLIKAAWENHDRSEELEETHHKNKDSLAALIIDARTNRSKKSTLFPSQSEPSSSATNMNPNLMQESPQDSSITQPWPVTRLQTRAKSSLDLKQMDTSRGVRQNGTMACSRSQQRKSTFEAAPAPGITRKTRSATQATTQSNIYSSSSSWSSSLNSEQLVEEPPVTRTPRRLSNRGKAVKFIGRRSGGPTPIAFRTRRSSNHRSVTRASVSSKSRSTRGANTPNLRSPRFDVVTPTRSTRKLRNGKVIPLKKMIGDRPNGNHPSHEHENGATSSSSHDDDEATLEDDSEDQPEMGDLEDEVASQIGTESDVDICSAQSEDNSSEDDAFDIAEDDHEPIQIDSEDEGDDDDDDVEYDEDETLVDLSQATSKGLLRLKRDNLIRLCEEREIQAEGTKKNLVQNLLAWRDTNEAISPSSDASQQSPAESMASEEQAYEEEGLTPTANSPVVSLARTADGTSSRPIILDSTVTDQKPFAEKTAIKTPMGPKTALQKKDDIGELLDLESLNLQDKEIQPEQLKKLELIGSGGFKDVYRGFYKKVPVAIAEIRGHLTEMDLKELRILRDLRHENIVRFIGVSVPTDSSNCSSSSGATTTATKAASIGSKKLVVEEKPHLPPIMVVTEICTNGDLFDYLRKTPSPGFLKICQIFRDICRGLDYLHSHSPKIIHRDLKSSNVLITNRGVAKLNDFGLARIKNSTRSMVKSLVGTVNWQAPELWVAHPRYNEKVDVYSAGLVLWEMLQWHQPVKRYPFEGQNEHAIYHDVGHRQLRPATAGMRRQWGDEMLNLVEKLWAQNPADRPRMDLVLVELESIVTDFKARSSAS